MSEEFRVLLVEDVEADAMLAVRELTRAGLIVDARRVDREEEFRRELGEFRPHIVLADFSMPQFNGMTALAILRESHPEIPFVFLSGTIGEEYAIRALKKGASDYVLKNNLVRLPPAVERAIHDSKASAEKRRAEAELRELELRFQATFEQAAVGIAHVGLEGRIIRANDRLAEILGYSNAELVGRNVKELTHQENREHTMNLRAHLRAGDIEKLRKERQYRRKDGSLVWVWLTTSIMRSLEGVAQCEISVFEDVTTNKRAEQLLRLEHTVAQCLADANNSSEGLKAVIRAVCETERWECGRYFHSDEDSKVLRFADSWGIPDSAVQQFLAKSRELTYAPGVGLAGKVWESRQPIWSTDITRDARVAQSVLARDIGMRGAFVFPIISAGKTVGVLAFDSREVREPEERLLQSVRVIGHQIGQFMVRMAQQERIARLNRIYAVLSGINAAIVRIRDRQELFQAACDIAVDSGRFRMAWLGIVDDQAEQVKPVAWAGDVRGFFDSAPLAVTETKPGGHGLAGRAVREMKPMISNDVLNDPQRLMKKECEERGINSLAVIPLIVGSEAVGILALYAADAGFFDDEEMKLLLELAGDISFALDHIEKAEKIEYLAYYDSLTGLANRSLFHERLVQYVGAAQGEKSKLAVAVVDVDRFKTINDTLGRQAGDELLRQIAERIERYAGPIRMARISADRFAIVRSGVSSESEVARLIEQWLAECFGLPYVVSRTELRVSAKAGVALFPNDGQDADALFRNAEAALKKAKATGERYLFHTPQMTERIAEKLTLENELKQALEKEQFVLHYQPKVDTVTRRIDSVEALIRWRSPELGLVPPMKFIPLLEETGLILEVGAWALRRAVLDHRDWEDRGLPAPRISVNVSAIQLRKRDFVATVEEAIKLGPVPPGIDLEITESLVMADIEANVKKLEALGLLGVGVAVDDFGTGYSSLGYLAKLPVQSLKIDRSFIITMLKDPAVMTLVSTIISLAHSLKLKVIAEGVDAEEQAKVLKRLGCDQMQGYLFSKPVPGDQLEKLLARASQPPSRKAGIRRHGKRSARSSGRAQSL
jgi:diguanylate cyclase (GGDEF)-like protein/PAS domain S-box-containing protein